MKIRYNIYRLDKDYIPVPPHFKSCYKLQLFCSAETKILAMNLLPDLIEKYNGWEFTIIETYSNEKS